MLGGHAAGLGLRHNDQRQPQRQHAAAIAEAPAPARHAPQRGGPGQFRQERRDHGFAHAIAVVRNDDGDQRQPDIARPGLGQRQRGADAADGAGEQQPPLGRARVGAGAQRRHGQHDEQVGQRQRRRPGQRGPGRTRPHHTDEIGAEHRREDDGGVAGIGEVIHGPGPDLARHAGIQEAVAPVSTAPEPPCGGSVLRLSLIVPGRRCRPGRSGRPRWTSRPTRRRRRPHGHRPRPARRLPACLRAAAPTGRNNGRC